MSGGLENKSAIHSRTTLEMYSVRSRSGTVQHLNRLGAIGTVLENASHCKSSSNLKGRPAVRYKL